MTAQSMDPKDVPMALVDAAWPVCEREGIPWHDDAVRMILAAVAPLVRAQVADEIAAHFAQERAQVADAEPVTLGGLHEQAKLLGRYDRVLATIDRIARGDQ